MDWTDIVKTFIVVLFGSSGFIISVFKNIAANKQISKEQIETLRTLQGEMKKSHDEIKKLYRYSDKRDNDILNKIKGISNFMTLQSKVNCCVVKCIKNEEHNGDLEAAIQAVEKYEQKKEAMDGQN